ncbi:MAG TPA: DsbA family oxidoreductase [Rhizomicrobium sp.]|jgi:predicted DsbA family dithiol-disulfide isomerase|nr:DsbA family oxidoreductase [Rhizomicrobium sp.]
MQIDMISDTVCPWCFIAKRRLARAMAMRPQIAFDVKWRPYRLDPTVPSEGMDRQAYMRLKFGEDPMKIVEMHKLIAAEGAKDGIEFDFAAIARRPDTLDSHRLIRWAEAAGAQDEVVERLFIAYFENGEDIGDIRVLADIADICGMDGVEIAQMLETDTDLALVEREDRLAHEMGVTGVPAMIFGNRLAVSGAREPELLLSVIDRVAEMATAQPAPQAGDDDS